MRRIRLTSGFILSGLLLAAPHSEAQTAANMVEMPYDLTLTFGNSAFGKAGDVTLQQVDREDEARAEVAGTERSQCNPSYGRRSLATSAASGEQLERRSNSYRIRLRSSASAIGGHYRTYVKCFGTLGFANRGHDTLAEARATAGARLDVKFRNDAAPVHYRLRISSSTAGTKLVVNVHDDQGKPVPLDEASGGLSMIEGGPNRSYRVELGLDAEASNSGGCCSSRMDASANVDLAVEVVSAASSDRQTALSVGGEEVKPTDYMEVGALSLIQPEVALFTCTGTLVSPTTVLTAAHCIEPFIEKIKARQMIFTIGKFAGDPIAPPIVVAGFSFPGNPEHAADPDRFAATDLSNDIGLIYLEAPVTQVTKFPKRFLEPPT